MESVSTFLFPIAVAILIAAVCIGGYIVYTERHTDSLNAFVSAYAKGDALTRERIADEYLTRYPAQDLLDTLEARYADDVCHLQAHPIGRAIYKRTQNFTESTRQCGGACTYGCFHGVLMGMFATDSDTLGGVIEDESSEEYLAHVQRVAKDLCTKPEVESVVRKRTCYHGLGHVFEYIEHEDLQRGLKSCDVFEDASAHYSCVTGVFMEHLFSASSTAVMYTRDTRPCDAFPEYTNECYIYKSYGWLKAWGSTRAAITACESFGQTARSCIVHVAQAAANMKLLETKEGFDSICGSVPLQYRDACFEGAIVKVIDLNNGDDSEHACDRIALMYYGTCIDVLKAFHEHMNI
jgi:hypothetical protein